MPLYPRYGREVETNAAPSRPQVQERMTREDEERLGPGFGLRELGMFRLRTRRAVPGQFFLEGAVSEDLDHDRAQSLPAGDNDAT